MLQEDGCGIDRVLDFELSDDELIRRLSGRRSCPGCQAVYHMTFNPPRKADECDRCGEKLLQRSDDQPETIRKRLEVYQSHTLPLIRYYEDRKLLARIDGSGSPEEVYRKVVSALGTKK